MKRFPGGKPLDSAPHVHKGGFQAPGETNRIEQRMRVRLRCSFCFSAASTAGSCASLIAKASVSFERP